MDYLLDTVAIIRHFSGHGRIGRKAKTIIGEAEQGKHTLLISVVSLFEIMYLAEKNRIKISLSNTLTLIQHKPCYRIADLSPEIVIEASGIKFYELHDRLILATAKYLNVGILSSDLRFDELKHPKRIWRRICFQIV
jgi:PIN domain nuclease of toxin-antitoxin system